MYSLLHAQMIQTRQDEIDAETAQRLDIEIRPAAARRRSLGRRRARKMVAAFGMCVAVVTGVAVSDSSARQAVANQSIRVSARDFNREMTALNAVGFVATSCEVSGTLMVNYRTNQSLILPF